MAAAFGCVQRVEKISPRRLYAEPHLTDRVVLIALILGSHRWV